MSEGEADLSRGSGMVVMSRLSSETSTVLAERCLGVKEENSGGVLELWVLERGLPGTDSDLTAAPVGTAVD